MRAVLSILALASLMVGCGPEEPFPQPSNKMGQARPVPPTPAAAPPSPGGIVAENCTIRAPLGELLEPVGRGPLRLVAIKCSNPVIADWRQHANLVSPDGSSVALLGGSPERRLTFQPITGGEDVVVPVPTPQVDFTTTSRGMMPFAWSPDSAFLWGVAQPPGGDDGLRPTLYRPDGRVESLPMLSHSAGPLYDLLWTRQGGLALAAFGVNSGLNRPPATLAFVDARRGRILETVNVARLGLPLPLLTVRDMAVTALPDGRLRAALAERDLVVWTQGERPRRFSDPFEGVRTPLMRFTPDGTGLLAIRPLQTDGGTMCRSAHGGCGPGRPVEGVLVALHDVRTGAARWRIRARVITDEGFPLPAISRDGQLALIGLPRAEGSVRRIALVRMTDGRILQELPAPPQPWFGEADEIGFSDASSFWVRSAYLTVFYRIDLRH